jgi:hypothetical protein
VVSSSGCEHEIEMPTCLANDPRNDNSGQSRESCITARWTKVDTRGSRFA